MNIVIESGFLCNFENWFVQYSNNIPIVWQSNSPNCCTRAACSTESNNDAASIFENNSQALL